MADQFQLASSGNWWDSSSTSFHSGPKPASAALSSTGSFGWSTEMVDMKARSCMDSISVSAGSSMEFADLQKLQAGHESSSCGLMTDQNLPIMGLGLSSQGIDWNQAVFSDEKTESNSFRTTLQGNGMSSNTNFQQDSVITSSQDHQWRQKIYTTSPDNSSHISSNVESTVTCQGLAAMDSAAYGNPTMLQGLLASDNQPQKSSFGDGSMNYSYPSSYAMNTGDFMMPNWSKFPQLKGTAAAMNDVQPSFFPSLQQAQVPTPIFREKQKTTSEVRTLYTRVKKTSSETSTKRPRNDTTSTLPTCKVRKEKMGDRITALQQLVSPFGKTDTASVLSEAIEYIKFLHDQVSALSTPYMKSGASIQHHQSFDKSKNPEGPKLDLKSRGLCFVPISSTFPITHETAVDFWTPTLGGTFG